MSKNTTLKVCTDQVTNENASEASAVAAELKELARQITELRELLEQLLDDLWGQSAHEDSQETSDAEW